MIKRLFVLLFALLVLHTCSMFRSSDAGKATPVSPDTSTVRNSSPASPASTPKMQSSSSQASGDFYQLQQDVDSLKQEIRQLKRTVRNPGSNISPYLLKQELQKVTSIPEITHEIHLINGTTVQGKVLRENVDAVIVQTQIGQLTLKRNLIKDIRPAEPPKAQVVIDGPITEKNFDGKKVYSGSVKNTGLARADFARIVFKLSDPSARIVATDSAFVNGKTHMYRTGVISDTSVEPGEAVTFTCPVFIPPNTKISYYTYEVHWSEAK